MMVKKLLDVLVYANDKNNIELYNALTEEIFNLLYFESNEDKENYLNFVATFTDWDEYKKITLAHAKKIINNNIYLYYI